MRKFEILDRNLDLLDTEIDKLVMMDKSSPHKAMQAELVLISLVAVVKMERANIQHLDERLEILERR